MFLDDTKERPYVFEILVLQALLNNHMEWRAVNCRKNNVLDVTKWPVWNPNLRRLAHLQKENENVSQMECNRLYVPIDD